MQSIPKPLEPLTRFDQWVLYKLTPLANGKNNKIPVDVTGAPIDPHDPFNWLPAQVAIDIAGTSFGVAFVFTENDPFWFVDIDNCLQPDNTWSPIANELMTRLAGCAVEVSQSGKGLHIFGRGSVPDHGCKNIELGLEFYTEKRFVALTGTNAIGDANHDATAALAPMVDTYFPVKDGGPNGFWQTGPVEGWNGPTDDDELIEKMLKSKSAGAAFGKTATFAQLWNRDEAALAECYPDDGRAFDESSADSALATHLAFWTGNDCNRMSGLLWRSGLVREKWKKHKSYIRRTISSAAARQKNFYSVRETSIKEAPDANDYVEKPVIRDGFQYMGVSMMAEYFDGFVYVSSDHKVFTPKGFLLNPERFKATYGGYEFQLTADGQKTTKDAFVAFTQSQAIQFPKVDSLCFRPRLPPGAIVNENGVKMVNTYVPIQTPSVHGDVTPFLDHVTKLLPNQRDQDILISYLAAIVQHKGVKFTWCPLLIGAPGNGKSFFSLLMQNIVGRKYWHPAKASELHGKFNSWLEGKLLITVEDIFIADHRDEVIEALKPMITDETIQFEGKGIDQRSGDNYANFILNSNRIDAVRKDENDRRFAVLLNAQMTKEDMIRDGIGESSGYHRKLYQWAREENGWAIIHNYLSTVAIPDELNPATGAIRAPQTSTEAEVISASLGYVEQQIVEAVEEGRIGFCGGWISSVAVEKLLKDVNRKVPLNKRREMLQTLGYDYHPVFKDGRASSPSSVDDNKKPRIFIKKGHIHQNLTNSGEAMKHYLSAQGQPIATHVAGVFKQ